MARERVAVFLLLTATLSLPACGNSSSPDKIASSFLHHYYEAVDLLQAKKLTEGLASEKIEQEQALLQGRRAVEEARRRNVNSRLLEKRSEGDRLSLAYELTIKGRGVPLMHKRAILLLRKVDGGWRVTNFRDFDL